MESLQKVRDFTVDQAHLQYVYAPIQNIHEVPSIVIDAWGIAEHYRNRGR